MARPKRIRCLGKRKSPSLIASSDVYEEPFLQAKMRRRERITSTGVAGLGLWMELLASAFGVDVLNYAVMSNHVHSIL
ncbi:MAG: hypothetical protein U0905_03615 [Pirellulales bacterium]